VARADSSVPGRGRPRKRRVAVRFEMSSAGPRVQRMGCPELEQIPNLTTAAPSGRSWFLLVPIVFLGSRRYLLVEPSLFARGHSAL
jgi:hypothetical protein